jgi:hypothetical protein
MVDGGSDGPSPNSGLGEADGRGLLHPEWAAAHVGVVRLVGCRGVLAHQQARHGIEWAATRHQSIEHGFALAAPHGRPAGGWGGAPYLVVVQRSAP